MEKEQTIEYPPVSEETKHMIESLCDGWFPEVQGLLPSLSRSPRITYYQNFMIKEVGCGGFAYRLPKEEDPGIVSVSFNEQFSDKEAQLKSLRGLFYHELFHLSQGVSGVDPTAPIETPLDVAIYEGAATVFEREHAGTAPLWGDYSEANSDKLANWVKQHQTRSIDTIYNWKFFDNEDGVRWKVYKTGVYIADQAIEKSGRKIEELALLSASEIFALAALD